MYNVIQANKIRGVMAALLLLPAWLVAETSATLHPIKGQPLAKSFTLPDLEDKPRRLQDYRGKVVIINFWATWCPPCRYEFPSMERAYQHFKREGIELFAINVGEDTDTIYEFTADYPVSFPILLDFDAKVIKDYGVVGLPTTYIIDPQGRLRYQFIGTREWDEDAILKTVRQLQDSPKSKSKSESKANP